MKDGENVIDDRKVKFMNVMIDHQE